MLSGHKKVKMVLEMKFQDKTKSKRCDCAMQKNDSMNILEYVPSNMGKTSTSNFMQVKPLPLPDFSCNLKKE